ncbi:MAG: type III secretion system export apparatus subunit SctV [Chlamydiia bacterium]|nr:type III secretion system export apparatus subunit SctV [Chlamydiia bacterium]
MIPAFIKNNRVFQSIASGKDLVLAIGLIGILIMMISPIPTFVLDIAITLNLTFSLIFIIASVYIPNIVKIASFPSALLLVTTYRLALHVAASRQILTKGYAGRVIATFGKYAAGGNYVVGGVVFLVITILQFVVIVKGAERISEVTARFALDAMPGKQMAIEADMRAGTLNAKQARERRSDVQKESQLFGSMDGALKFVKGDAIAGLIVAFVNILGGIIIGMIIQGLPLVEAIKKYLLLTIGEGLVSQVAALLVAVASGIMITKVTSTDPNAKTLGLAGELVSQLFALPTPLLISGVFLALIGFVPGMPWYIFVPVGILIFYSGVRGIKATSKEKPALGMAFKDVVATGHAYLEGEAQPMMKTIPVIIETGKELSNIILGKAGSGINFMEIMIPKMRLALYNDVGVSFPGIHINVNNNLIKVDEYIIMLNEVPEFHGKIFHGHILVNETKETLDQHHIEHVTYKNSLGMPYCWAPESYKTTLNNLSIKTWSIPESVILAISLFYIKNSESFMGIQETKAVLAFTEQDFPDLVKECSRLIPIQKIAEILKRLIAETISIKDMRAILESIVEHAQSEKNPSILVEYIRENMCKYITYRATMGQNILNVYIIDPGTEDLIRSSIKETSDGSYLALNPEYSANIINSAKKVIKNPHKTNPTVITTMDIRRFVYKILSSIIPNILVVSYQELEHDIETKPLGTISV